MHDPSVTSQQIGTQSLKGPFFYCGFLQITPFFFNLGHSTFYMQEGSQEREASFKSGTLNGQNTSSSMIYVLNLVGDCQNSSKFWTPIN